MNHTLLRKLSIFTLLLFSASLLAQVSIIAHRGASAYALENSLAAFNKAYELNADAVELDIWRTTDDSLVVMHDRTTGRTATKDLVVPESSASQLRKIKLNNGERIPYLQEVLKNLPTGKKIVIEIKCCWEKGNAGNVFPMLKRILINSGRLNDAIIIAFNPETLAEAKKQLPNNKCYWLTYQKDQEDQLIETCKKNNFDGLNVNYGILTDSLSIKCKKNNLDLLAWTVDKPESALFTRLNNKVTGITTNKPDLIRDILSKNNYESTYYGQKRSIHEMIPTGVGETIFLGNSITDIGEWSDFFQTIKVKNRGISGDITLGVLARLDKILSAKPAKIFLMIGINDIANNIPDSIILQNYRMIVEKIQVQSAGTRLFIQSILPTNSIFPHFARHQNKTEHILFINNKLNELCIEKKLTYIDVFSTLADDNNNLKPIYTNDGLHLMAEGYKQWIEVLKQYINEPQAPKSKYEGAYYLTRLKAHRAETIAPNSIIFIGNSITEQGWWNLLFKSKNIVNRGIGGDNTYGILNRLPEIMQTKPSKVFLMDGINDITAGRGVEEISANILKMIEICRTISPATTLYIQNVLPLNDDCLAYDGLKGKNTEVVKLNAKLKEICAENRITYIDIASLVSDNSGQLKATLTKDGIHLQPEGYQIWAAYLKKMKYIK